VGEVGGDGLGDEVEDAGVLLVGVSMAVTEPRFQFGDSGFQRRNPPLIMLDDRPQERLKFKRQSSELLGSDRRLRHAQGVADFRPCAKTSFSLRGMNGCLTGAKGMAASRSEPRRFRPESR